MLERLRKHWELFIGDVLPHLLYLPDIASSDYHFFRSVAHSLADKHFQSYEHVEK